MSPRRAASSGASRRIARAMAMRWRCPPDSVTPRSPSSASKPPRQPADEFGWHGRGRRHARHRRRIASGRPKRMFSRALAANTTESCGTSAMRARNLARIGRPRRGRHRTRSCRRPDRRTAAADETACSCRRRTDRRSQPSRRPSRASETPSSTLTSRPRRIGKADVVKRDIAARRRPAARAARRRHDRRLDARGARTGVQPRRRPRTPRPRLR